MRNKLLFVFFLFVASLNKSNCQDSIYLNNKKILEQLEQAYKESCIEIDKNYVPNRKFKKDKKIIKDLNLVFQMGNDTTIFSKMNKIGFYKNSEVSDLNNKIVLYAKHAGNLRVWIEFIINSQTNIIAKKIVIATETKFRCKTLTSYEYSLVDFLYLKRIVKFIKMPIELSKMSSELDIH